MLDDTKGLIAGIVICAIVIVVIIAILCCMCKNKEGFTPAQRMQQSRLRYQVRYAAVQSLRFREMYPQPLF